MQNQKIFQASYRSGMGMGRGRGMGSSYGQEGYKAAFMGVESTDDDL